MDWEKAALKVQRQLRRMPCQGKILVYPKTETRRRQVKLGQIMLVRLAAYRRQQEVQKVEAGEKWEEHGLIFLNIFGRSISSENLYAQFNFSFRFSTVHWRMTRRIE